MDTTQKILSLTQLWVLKDLDGSSPLEDPPPVKEADFIRHLLCKTHLMGGKEHRHPIALEVAYQTKYLIDQDWIEGRGDLIE